MSKQVQIVTGKMRTEYSLEEKQRILREFQKSGMTLNSFSKSIGISPSNLCQWKQKIVLTDEEPSTECKALEAAQVQTQNLSNEIYQALKDENRVLKSILGKTLIEREIERQTHA